MTQHTTPPREGTEQTREVTQVLKCAYLLTFTHEIIIFFCTSDDETAEIV